MDCISFDKLIDILNETYADYISKGMYIEAHTIHTLRNKIAGMGR